MTDPAPTTATSPHPIHFAVAIALGAFLLFVVQPMIARLLLPGFGGAASVWIVSLLFFQTMLLGGYYYAHLLVTHLSGRRQAQVHAGLVLLATVLAFLEFGDVRGTSISPTTDLLLALALRIGPAFLVLAATSPLIQHWYARAHTNPYRLYALSNLGSLGGLIAYPFLVEPFTDLSLQLDVWRGALMAYLAFVLLAARGLPTAVEGAEDSKAIRMTVRLSWLVLAGCGSMMLLSVSNVLTRQIAPFPLLWVWPLLLYLLTFILTFDHPRWYRPLVFRGLWLVAVCYLLSTYQIETTLDWAMVAVYSAILFCSCMICHGELVRLRPEPEQLSSFYLMVAAGGVAGALLVSVVAPQLFSNYYEFELALALTLLLGGIYYGGSERRHPFAGAGWATVLLALPGYLVYHHMTHEPELIAAERSFYARYTVVHDLPESDQSNYKLYSDGVTHGSQLRNQESRRIPTTYYSTKNGIGITLNSFPGTARKIGIVGLGVGTIAAYGEPGDSMRFYEIDDTVITLARRYFTFLADSIAKVSIVRGDARISLEREAAVNPGSFDVLIIDAFSGDAIPIHLLTREAWTLYWRLLKPDGILGVHISNNYFELAPIVMAHEAGSGRELLRFENQLDSVADIYTARWLIVTGNESFLEYPLVKRFGAEQKTNREPVLWTDERASILPILLD